MRTAQVNLHVELFGDQVPHGWPEGERCSFHVYADARNVGEAVTAAVAEFSRRYQGGGGRLGTRVDSVSSADEEEFDRKLARRLEPTRIVDARDCKAIAEHLRKEREEGDA